MASANRPTYVFLEIWLANNYWAETCTNPYLLDIFLAKFFLLYFYPPKTIKLAGLLGLFDFILNFKSLAISYRIYYLLIVPQSTSK